MTSYLDQSGSFHWRRLPEGRGSWMSSCPGSLVLCWECVLCLLEIHFVEVDALWSGYTAKKKKKNIAKINVKGLYCFVYFYFYGFRSFTFKSLIFVLSWFLCMAVQFHCFAWAVQYSQKLSLKRLSFLHCIFSINLFLKVFFFFFLLDREFSTILRLSFWRQWLYIFWGLE